MYSRVGFFSGGALAALLFLVAMPAAAQEVPAFAPSADPVPATTFGDTLFETPVPEAFGFAASRAPTPITALEPALQPEERRRAPLGLAMMASGGALLFAGSFIDNTAGTVVMVGGAGVIAWGVYRLLR